MQGSVTLFLVLGISAAFAATEFDFPETRARAANSGGVVPLPDSCLLPCTVVYVGRAAWFRNVVYLNVHWEARLANDDTFHSLLATNYWHQRDEPLGFSVPYSHCRRHPDSGNDTLVADCSLHLGSCSERLEDLRKFVGDYRCYVRHVLTGYSASVTSRLEVQEPEVDPNGDPTNDARLHCYIPKAEDIVASIVTDSSGAEKLNITWVSTRKPPEKDSYCAGSRRWLVRALTYDSQEGLTDEDSRADIASVIFRSTAKARQTHYELSDPLRDKYYIFQVQNSIPQSGGTGERVTFTYSSYIHYFGNQTQPYLLDTREREFTVSKGEDVPIRCAAGGLPPPDLRLVYQGSDIKLTKNQFILREASEENVGDYYCSASNIHVNPPQGRRRFTVNKKITVRLMPASTTQEWKCQDYHGDMCRLYLFADTPVFTNASDETLESTINSHVGAVQQYTADHRRHMDSPAYRAAGIAEEQLDKCLQFLTAISCNLVYPYCEVGSTSPRPICKHSCDELREGGACGFFFDTTLLPEDAHQLRELKNKLLANCDSRVNPAGTRPECIYVSYQSPPIDGGGDQITKSSCVKGKGRGYSARDHVRTESGIACQSWSSQHPNMHSIKPSHFRVELLDAGFACRNPGGLGERPWCYTSTLASGKRWEYCDVPQCEVCERYSLRFCSSLPGYADRTVYIDREEWSRLSMGDIEGNMVGLYHSLEGDKLTPGCQNALRHIICHGSLPLCKSEASPSPLKSCRDHCTLLDEMSLHCPESVTRTLRQRWTSNSVSRLVAPDCSLTAGQAECMPVRLSLTAKSMSRRDCYNGSDYGLGYNGSVSHTVTGSQCVRWVDTNTSYTDKRYPELSKAGNGCRNPGQWRETPWCFTADGGVELCGVESCDSHNEQSKGAQQGDDSTSVYVGFSVFLALGVIAIVVVVVVVGLIVYMSYRKKRTVGNSPLQLQMIPSSNDNVKNMKFRENNQYNMVRLDQPLPPKVAEAIMSFKQIPQEGIEYVKQIGQGFFGMVFKGKMKPTYEGEEEVFVAVKTLKEDSNDGIEAFVNEAKLMFSFHHENIVQILGVSMTKAPHYLVFEYMDKGDLAKFLRENASSIQRRYMNPPDRPRSRTESTLSDDPASLNSEQLTDLCKQIASGMEYLSSMNYVHRDLACRNCLVTSVSEEDGSSPSQVIVKIGDFGLSHNLYSKDYYRVKGQAVLPIRWMSPEAIIYGKFSTAGDVWSFGVVMWEIFTFGMQPYYGTSNEEVMERVRHGKVLSKPADCSGRMYTVMTECWQKSDQARPTFTEILQFLDSCRGSVSSEDAQSIYSDISSDAFLEENSDPETECVGVP